MSYHTKTINFLIFMICTMLHIGAAFLTYQPSFKVTNKQEQRIDLKLKDGPKIRQIGKKNSKKKEYIATPSKKSEGLKKKSASLSQFQVDSQANMSDLVQARLSAIKKVDEKNNENLKKLTKARINYAQKQIMAEAQQIKTDENPLLNHLNYNMKFEAPKGLKQKELNELEKVFYSFFKRVAVKYITSIHTSVNDAIINKPYLKDTLRSHPPKLLKAVIHYDSEGNAEVVKILNSSVNDDVHEIFEKSLSKMVKIPNIAKSLRDEKGKYTAYFQLNLN